MRVKNYLDLPSGMNKHWEWVVALDAWDYCDPSLLIDLLVKMPIPEEIKIHIGNIVDGSRKPNKKGASKLKIPAKERMRIAGSLSLVLGLCDAIKYEGKNGYCSVEAVADRERKEPLDILRELEFERQSLLDNACRDLNVSNETLENLLRDLREKIKNWPNV